MQLGYGAAQRRIWTAESDQTSAIAEGIAQDKDFTKRLLAACGVPVPEGQIVHSPEEAWEVAQDIGFPVTVKPSDGNHARGVTLDLRDEADIKAAFALAQPEGSDVIVERFIDGTEHRILVVGGKVVAACRGETVSVAGNGKSTVRELVAVVNQDPRRGPEQEYPLDWINLEAPAVKLELKRQNVTPDTIPAQGTSVLLQRNGNMAIDCTDEVHPEVAYMATLAAKIVGLDIAGMDMILQDVSRPMKEQGGAILEVNAGPGLLMHLKPTSGARAPRGHGHRRPPVPAHRRGHGRRPHPLVGIAGTRNNGFTARLVGWLLQLSGKLTGVASSEGMFLSNRQTQKTNTANWAGAHRLLTNRLAQAAVIQTTARSILEEGLAYDRCLVGVVTDMDGFEQLPDHDVHEQSQMTRVMRTQIDVVLDEGAGVLNADIEQVADLARLCDGEVLFYSMQADSPVVAAHRCESEGRAVFVRGNQVILATGAAERVLGTLDALSLPGGLRPDTPALLAAIAAAWSMDIAPTSSSPASRPSTTRRPPLRFPPPPPEPDHTMTCRQARRRGPALRKKTLCRSPASEPCAAPISGPAAPPSKPSCNASPATVTTRPWQGSRTGCAHAFPRSARCSRTVPTSACRWPMCWKWRPCRCRPRPAAP